jgi:3-hydroxyisobutyrate dehydrogenase-like beta-hydroxyacid dehydrogenase
MTKVAVVGLGTMGSRMARRLSEAGNDLVAWNRDVSAWRKLHRPGWRMQNGRSTATRTIQRFLPDPRAVIVMPGAKR